MVRPWGCAEVRHRERQSLKLARLGWPGGPCFSSMLTASVPHRGGLLERGGRWTLRSTPTYDATGLAQLVAAGQVSAAELLALARERAAAVNPRINAIVREMRPEADARAAGTLTGPFAGVPFLIKDLAQDYAGVPTSAGSRALATLPARRARDRRPAMA